MKIAKAVFLSLILCMAAGLLYAQVPELIKKREFRIDAQAAVDSLYNFNPEGADQRLSKWKEKYPSHPLWKLMDGMEFWWTILSDLKDTSHDEKFYKMMKEADYNASRLLYDQPGHADALIIRTVANGYVARQHSNRKEWVTSLNTARKAYNAYGTLQEQMPDFPDLKLADGLKLYYSEYLPEAYPVVKTISWFLPDGDKEKGLKKMQEAASEAIFARAEASYFLGNINHNYEHNYEKAVRYFKELHETYPNNNYYARLLVTNYCKMRRHNEALDVINNSLERWDEKNLPFKEVLSEELLFWKARILLRKGANTKALELFKKSLLLSQNLPRTQNRDYYPASAYYAGLILKRSDKPNQAKPYFKKAIEAETEGGYQEMARSRLEAIRTGG